MPIDPRAPDGAQTPENAGDLFAPTPIWARQRTGRRKPRAAAADRRDDPAMDAAEAGAGAGALGATTAAEPADMSYATQPVARTQPGGASRLALAAGVVVALLLAGAGWYAASRAHPSGLAQLTPGARANGETAIQTPGAGGLPLTRVSDPAADQAAAPPPRARRHRAPVTNGEAPSAAGSAMNSSTTEPQARTPATAAGTASMTQPTNLTPLAGTTSPVPPASTPSASSAAPGSSPAATPAPTTTP